jgi:hypothetical protein
LISSSIVFGQVVLPPKPIIVPPPKAATPPGGNQPPGGGGGGANVPNNYNPPTGSSDTVKSKSSPSPVPGADAGKIGSPFRDYMKKHNIP